MYYKNIFSKFDAYKNEVQNTLEEISRLQNNNINKKTSSESINNLVKQTLQLKTKIKIAADKPYNNNLADTNLQDIEAIITSNKLALKQALTNFSKTSSKLKKI